MNKLVKRILSVFLACLMILTSWVWIAPTEAEAADSGVYSGYIHVTINENNNMGGHIAINYYPVDPTTGLLTDTSCTMVLIDSWSGYDVEGTSYDIPFSVPGWPYSFEVSVSSGSYWFRSEVRVTGITIGNQRTSWGFNVKSGSGNSAETRTFNSDGSNTDGPFDTWKEPYVASGTNGNFGQLGSVTVPKLSDSSTVQSDIIEAQWYDQYGYEWPCTPSYSISNSELCALKTDGDDAYIQVTNSNLSALIPANGYSVEKGYADVTVTVKPYEGYTGESTANGYYRIYSPTFTVNFYDENGITSLGSGTCYYGGSVNVPSATKDYDGSYFYPFQKWVNVDDINKSVEISSFSAVTNDLNVKAVYKKTGTPVYETTLNLKVTNTPESGGHIKMWYYKFKDDGTGIDTSTSYECVYVNSLLSSCTCGSCNGSFTGDDDNPSFHSIKADIPGWPFKLEIYCNGGTWYDGTVVLKSFMIGEKNVLGNADQYTVTDKTYQWEINPETGAQIGNWGNATADWPVPAITTIEADSFELKTNDFGGSTVSKTVEFTLKDQYGVVWGIAPVGTCYISNDKAGTDTTGLTIDNIYCTETTLAGLPCTTVYAKPEVQLLNENKTTSKFYLNAAFGSAKCAVPVTVINSSYMQGVAGESNELVERIDEELLNADIDLVLEALLETNYDHESITLDTWKYDYEYKNADGTTTKVKKGEAVTTVREWIISSVINSIFSGSIPQYLLEKIHSTTGYEMYTIDGDLVSAIINDSFVYVPRTTRTVLVTMPHQFAVNWKDSITGNKPVAVTGVDELSWYKFFNGELYGDNEKYDYSDILRVFAKAPIDSSINNEVQARSYWNSFRYPDKMKDQGYSQYANNDPAQGLNPGYFAGTHPLYWYKLDSAGNVIDYRDESAYIKSGQGTSYNFDKMTDGITDYGYLTAEEAYDFAQAEADGYRPYYYSTEKTWGIENFDDFYYAINSALGGNQVLLATLLSGTPSQAEVKLAGLDLTLDSNVGMYHSLFLNLYSILGVDEYNETSNPYGYCKLADIQKLCSTNINSIGGTCAGFVAENNYGVDLWQALLQPIVYWIENELFVRPVESILSILPNLLIEFEENRILSGIIEGANVDVFLSLFSTRLTNINYSDLLFTGELAKLGIATEAAKGGINGILQGIFGLIKSETASDNKFALKKDHLSEELYEDENGYQYEGLNLDYQYEGLYCERNRRSDPRIFAQKLFDKIGQPYLDWLTWTDNTGTIGFDVPTEMYSPFIEIVQWLFDADDGFNKIKPLLEGRFSKVSNLEEYGIKETAEMKVIAKWLSFTDYSSEDYLAHIKRVLDNLKKLSPSGHANEDDDNYCDVCGREVILSGECGVEGDNLTWTLSLISGVLEISGTGDMADYDIEEYSVPWLDSYAELQRYIKTVIINDGATSIGNYAFSGCYNIRSISLPTTLNDIGKYAFYYCNSLLKIIIPDSVQTIGVSAFKGCENLKTVNIPVSVISIGDSAFAACVMLERITVDKNNAYYTADEKGVLFDKSMTTLIAYPLAREDDTYVIPDTVTKISKEAFYVAYNLKHITLPNSIKNIGNRAFVSCINLNSVSIPANVGSIDRAFRHCFNLKHIYVSGISTYLQYSSLGLCECTLICGLGEYVKNYLLKVEAYERGDYKSAELYYSFLMDSQDWNKTNPNGTIYGFSGSTAETYANENGIDFVAIGNPNYKVTLNFDVINTIEGGGHIKLYYHPFKADGSGIDSSVSNDLIMVNSLLSSYSEIGSYAVTTQVPGWPYKMEVYLASKTLYKSEIVINGMQIGCVNVFADDFRYTMSASTTNIMSTFEVDSITGEPGGALSGTTVNWPIPAITQVYSNGATEVAVGKFVDGSQSQEYTFSAIDQYGVNWPIMPRGTYDIVDANDDTAIFNSNNLYCDSMSSAGLPAATLTVKPELQCLAPGQTSATYYIKSVFNGVVTKFPITFVNPTYTVAFDSNGGTFADEELATMNLVYGQKINHIPADGTKENKQLLGFIRDVKLADSSTLKDPSPTNTKYKWLRNSSLVDETGDATWYAVWALKDVDVTFRMPSGESIAKLTGKYNNSMINAESGREMYLTIEALNKAIKNRNRNNNVTFNNENEPVFEGDGATYIFSGWKLVEMFDLDGNAVTLDTDYDVTTAVLTGNAVFEAVFEVAETDGGYCGADENGENLTWTVNVAERTLTISGAGEMRNYYVSKLAPWHGYRNYIETIVIEEDVTSIGNFAFYECRNVDSLIWSEGVERIGKSAFNGCDSMTAFAIPASVNEIGTKAFHSCDALLSFTVADGNRYFTALDGVLFNADMTALIKYPDGKTDTEYVFPGTVKAIAEHSFSASENLVSIEISDHVEVIENSAFYGCTNLESIVLGNTVTVINPYAFYGCTKLSGVTLSNSIQSIGDWAFYKCDSLTDVNYTGTESEWDLYDLDRDNNVIAAATVTYNYEIVSNSEPAAVMMFSFRRPIVDTECEHVLGSVVTEATCTEQGYTTYVCECGYSYTDNYTELSQHDYKDSDVCANCGFDRTDNCNCKCHEDNIFGIIYKIILIIQRIFKFNSTCLCGSAHY